MPTLSVLHREMQWMPLVVCKIFSSNFQIMFSLSHYFFMV
jgi:hypothetical protein